MNTILILCIAGLYLGIGALLAIKCIDKQSDYSILSRTTVTIFWVFIIIIVPIILVFRHDRPTNI